MRYLERAGYHVLPVNPLCEEYWPSLAALEEPVDLVDVFRHAEFCPAVARETFIDWLERKGKELGEKRGSQVRRGRSPVDAHDRDPGMVAGERDRLPQA